MVTSGNCVDVTSIVLNMVTSGNCVEVTSIVLNIIFLIGLSGYKSFFYLVFKIMTVIVKLTEFNKPQIKGYLSRILVRKMDEKDFSHRK